MNKINHSLLVAICKFVDMFGTNVSKTMKVLSLPKTEELKEKIYKIAKELEIQKSDIIEIGEDNKSYQVEQFMLTDSYTNPKTNKRLPNNIGFLSFSIFENSITIKIMCYV